MNFLNVHLLLWTVDQESRSGASRNGGMRDLLGINTTKNSRNIRRHNVKDQTGEIYFNTYLNTQD